jgi:type II secretory pathway pseudopilin PulG
MRTLHPGCSLLELIVALTVLAILLGMAVPAARTSRDALAVRAARAELAAALARTRAAAIASGGARLEIDATRGLMSIITTGGDTVGSPLALGDRHAVTVSTGAAGPATIRYDGLGIGRFASRTIVIQRGRAEARIIVSAYGRWRAS